MLLAGKQMYESDDIVNYLFNEYGPGEAEVGGEGGEVGGHGAEQGRRGRKRVKA